MRSSAPPSSRDEVGAEELLAFLADPASYPHGPEQVEMRQTHISYVALAGTHVYKVKKSIDFGFVDFSTLEKRRHYCEEEVRLNRRLCARIYEGVVPIYRGGGGLSFEEGDTVAAYAVKMHRLPEEHFLDERLARGAVAAEDLRRVARKLTAFYREQDPSAEIAEWGRTEKLKISTDENFEQTRPCIGHTLSRPAYAAIRYFTNRFYDQQATLINRRRAGGHIVDGHGDLRLEHVHLMPEDVCIYDCIEFSDRLRYVDTANDVAFLAMDLDVHGRPDLSGAFARQMAEALEDPELLAMIDFYKCYRAYVRGKVESLRSLEEEVPEEERRASQERAQHHFRWALQYATAGSGPAVLAVMGGIGSGKSTQAHALGEALGWEVVSSDRVRKEQAGVALHERGGEELYTKERTQRAYAALRERALERAAKGHGTVLDATFGRKPHRDALREALRTRGIPYCFVELTADRKTVEERLRAREGRRSLSDARLEDLEMLESRYEAPDALEDIYHFTASTEGDPAATTTAVLKHLVRFEL